MARTRASRSHPPFSRMLARGLCRRCPRCGSGGLFSGWFRMVERCPRCGYRFDREGELFFGAYVVNFGITEGLLALALFAWVLRALGDPGREVNAVPVLVVGAVVAVGAPLLFFPFSRTIWAAIELALEEGRDARKRVPAGRGGGAPGT